MTEHTTAARVAAADYRDITLECSDPVAIITMNRPAALNAFTTRMLAEIKHAIAVAEADPQVVGIVLTGAGRGFCAGMDMNALADLSQGDSLAEDLSPFDAAPGDPVAGEPFLEAFGYLLAVRKPVL
ncbi:MAG: enoyl-CoA hydratase-related protein [Pseudomonadota bacterium]